MSYAQGNSRTILNAFNRLRKSKDRVIEAGFPRLLNDAMLYAISIHDHEHFGHRTHDNSYGWALVHDGKVVRMQVNGGQHGHGDAEDQLRTVAGRITRKGWVGVILASMIASYGRRKPFYYEVDYEMGILDMTQDEIQDHFTEYFKPIAV